MLKIRFRRAGRKNNPFFQIVVVEKGAPPRGGNAKEVVGTFNPLNKKVNVKEERVKYWISVGAKPSDTVYNLLISEGVVKGEKRPVHNLPEKEARKEELQETPQKEKAPSEEKSEEESKPEKKEGEEEQPEIEEEVEEEEKVEEKPEKQEVEEKQEEAKPEKKEGKEDRPESEKDEEKEESGG